MEAARIQSAATVSPEARSAAAAEKLGYTLSGISRSMMTLEKEAGFQLLQRKKSGSDWQHHVTRRLRRRCERQRFGEKYMNVWNNWRFHMNV